MADVTSDQVVEAAKGLGAQFTRAELASKLDVKGRELKAGIKEARQSGRLEKVGDDDQGRGLFKLAGE